MHPVRQAGPPVRGVCKASQTEGGTQDCPFPWTPRSHVGARTRPVSLGTRALGMASSSAWQGLAPRESTGHRHDQKPNAALTCGAQSPLQRRLVARRLTGETQQEPPHAE